MAKITTEATVEKIQVLDIAADIGSGDTKYARLYKSDSDKTAADINKLLLNLEGRVRKFRTAVGPAHDGVVAPGQLNKVVEFGDMSFFVENTAEMALAVDQRENTLSDHWAASEGYRALIYYVIALVAEETNVDLDVNRTLNVRLTLGLPQNQSEAGSKALAARFKGDHRFSYGGRVYHIHVVDVLVLPQPMGAFFYATQTVLSVEQASDRVGIIDIGRFTADASLSENLLYHAYESGGCNIGVSRLIQQLQTLLEKEYGITYSIQGVEKAFNTRKVLFKNEHVDINKLIEAAVEMVGRDIINSLPRSWNPDNMRLLLTGGGAEDDLFGRYFKQRFGNVKTLIRNGNPASHAIVMGYLIYALGCPLPQSDVFERM